jgi:hypothetical protein
MAVRRLLLLAAAAGAALAVVAGSSATVKRVSITAPVAVGGKAALTVSVAPRSRCTISVTYQTADEQNPLSAAGLGPKAGSRITWRWRVPGDAVPTGARGTPIEVRCVGSGTLRTRLVVGPVPRLPRILSARLVDRGGSGRAVRVSYCFSSLPGDLWTKPSRLHVSVDNPRDALGALGVAWRVTSRCDTIIHPVGFIKPPYVLRYSVESIRGIRSKRGQIRLT